MKTNNEKVEAALLSAKRSVEEVTPGPQWQDDVMRDIRCLSEEKSPPAWLPLLDNIVWRIAPALAALCILFFAFSMVVSGSPQTEVAQVLFFGPAEVLMTPALVF
jgi:hypothetical protein